MADTQVGYALGLVLGAAAFDDRLNRFLAAVGEEKMRTLRQGNPFALGLPPIRNSAGETVDDAVARCVLHKDGRSMRSKKTLCRNARAADHVAVLLRGQGDIALAAFYESVAADIRRILSEQGDANG